MYISMSMRDASTFASESYRMCTDTFVLKTWVHGATHPGQRCAKGCAITILPLDLMGFDQPLTVARRCSRSGTWIFLKNFHAWRPGRCHQPCFWPSLEYGEGILGMLRYTVHILSTEVLRFERFLRCHWISWIIFLRYYCRMLPFDQSVQVDAYVDLQHFVTRTSNYTVFDWDGAGIHGQPGQQNGWDVHDFHAEEALVPNIRQHRFFLAGRISSQESPTDFALLPTEPGTWNLQVDVWPGKGRPVAVDKESVPEITWNSTTSTCSRSLKLTTCRRIWNVRRGFTVMLFFSQVTGVEVWRIRPVQGACGAQKCSWGVWREAPGINIINISTVVPLKCGSDCQIDVSRGKCDWNSQEFAVLEDLLGCRFRGCCVMRPPALKVPGLT